jgi:serine/threonine protein kinase
VHPSIAQVYDFGEDKNTLYLVMEYVPGVSLRGLDSKLPPLIAARAIKDVCLGLHAAHELQDMSGAPLGVVHRDVSPENLMFTFEGAMKILDFGIALVRDRQAQETVLGHIKGKPAYMSPEQVNNEPIDRRSDIFSAGIVLYEILTGRPLFTGPSMLALALAVTSAQVPRPSALVPEIPSALDNIVLRALSRERDNRYETAAAMANELELFMAQERPISLETFARRELASLHEQHRDWLSRVVGSRTSVPSAFLLGRPEGVPTAIAPAASSRPPSMMLLKTPEPPTQNASIAKRPRSRAFLPVLLGLGVALIGAAAIVAISTREPRTAAPAKACGLSPGTFAERPSEMPDMSFPKLPGAPFVALSPAIAKPAKPPLKHSPSLKKASPRPAAESLPPVEEGKLTLGATPYAWVRIDGRMVGSTPLMGLTLSAGEHQIVLIRPDDGTVRHQETVTIPPGGHEHMLIK